MYYTCKEVAEMFKVKVSTVWLWIRQGRLDAIKLSYNNYRVSDESIKQFVANGRKAK